MDVAREEKFSHKRRRAFAGAAAFALLWGLDLSETMALIVAAHRAGTLTPEQTVARSYARIHAHGDSAIFISLRAEADALAEARALAAAGAHAESNLPDNGEAAELQRLLVGLAIMRSFRLSCKKAKKPQVFARFANCRGSLSMIGTQ